MSDEPGAWKTQEVDRAALRIDGKWCYHMSCIAGNLIRVSNYSQLSFWRVMFSVLRPKTSFELNHLRMQISEHARPSASRPAERMRTPSAHRTCDGVTEALLYFGVVFAPWAFGTTERWSIWTMNLAGYALGTLLLGKWLIRRRTGYRPMRWGEAAGDRSQRSGAGEAGAGGKAQNMEQSTRGSTRRTRSMTKLPNLMLSTLTVLILAYCLMSAINARSTFLYREMAFVPREYIAWLPHTYDSWATWQAFWTYLGLALTFWASRDWLLGKTARERQEARDEGQGPSDRVARHLATAAFDLPARLQRLLWVLCLNGAVLALEGILQRLSGTGKLLWLVQPVFNQTADAQFGPYAYRSNAAQYFNLVWPVCLGYWWTLRRANRNSPRAGARVGGGPHVLLLPCAVLMAAAPIISSSRGGAIVAGLEMLLALALLLFAQRRGHAWTRLGIVLLFAVALLLAGRFGWEKLEPRLKAMFSDEMSGRVEIYRNAQQMARDFPVFGMGPGTFPWVYHLYRATAQSAWAAYAHNDWLETRITFGWVGFVMIIAAQGIVFLRPVGNGGIAAHWLFISMIWLSLAGCLLHARFDFPFQIYSTLALFVQLGAILFCISRKESGRGSNRRS